MRNTQNLVTRSIFLPCIPSCLCVHFHRDLRINYLVFTRWRNTTDLWRSTCFWKCFGNYNNPVLFFCSGIFPCLQHEGVWGRRCMSPLFLNLGNKYELSSLHTIHFTPGESHASTYVIGVLMGTRKSLAFAGNRTKLLSRSAGSLVTVPTTLSSLVLFCGILTLFSGRRLNILLLCVSLWRRRLSCSHSYIEKITVWCTQLHREDYCLVHTAT